MVDNEETRKAMRDSYFRAIGEVVVRWSQIIGGIAYATWIVAKIDPQLGRAFTDEAQTVSLLTTLKTLVHTEVGETGKYEALLLVLDQLNDCRVKRNELVHAIWGFNQFGAYTMEFSANGKLSHEISNKYQNAADVEIVIREIASARLALDAWVAAWLKP